MQIVSSTGPAGVIITVAVATLLSGGQMVDVKLAVLSANDSFIVVRAGSGVPGTGNFVITAMEPRSCFRAGLALTILLCAASVIADTGAVVTIVGAGVYETASSITVASPTSGQFGTVVVITGSNLLGLTGGTSISTVTLAGETTSVVNGTASTIIYVVAAVNGSVFPWAMWL